MSMPSWLNDAHPFQSNENGAFNPGSGDPSMCFMQTPTTTSSSFDFSQMQNQQLQQRMQNGIARNGSPGYHNPIYQTQPLVPSKRPCPREDSIGASLNQILGPSQPRSHKHHRGLIQGFKEPSTGITSLPGHPHTSNISKLAITRVTLQSCRARPTIRKLHTNVYKLCHHPRFRQLRRHMALRPRRHSQSMVAE